MPDDPVMMVVFSYQAGGKSMRSQIMVRVPDGKLLGGVELFWNETRIATMFDPPFIQTVTIPSTDGVGYLRAVATLPSVVDGEQDRR